MATTTTHYGLIKPAGGEQVNINQINDNMDIIDQKIWESRPVQTTFPIIFGSGWSANQVSMTVNRVSGMVCAFLRVNYNSGPSIVADSSGNLTDIRIGEINLSSTYFPYDSVYVPFGRPGIAMGLGRITSEGKIDLTAGSFPGQTIVEAGQVVQGCFVYNFLNS